jgi:hypothetical protein
MPAFRIASRTVSRVESRVESRTASGAFTGPIAGPVAGPGPIAVVRLGLLVLLLAGTPASAEEWRRIGEEPVAGADSSYRGQRVVSVHLPTMQRRDGIVDFWLRASVDPPVRVAQTPEPVVEVREQRRGDCALGESRRVSGAFVHPGGASSPFPYDVHATAWTAAMPGTLEAAALREACDATTSRIARWMNRLVFW